MPRISRVYAGRPRAAPLIASTMTKIAAAGASIHGVSVIALIRRRLLQHRPPARLRIGEPEAEVRHRDFGEEQRRHEQDDLDPEKPARGRQEVPEEVERARAGRARGLRVVAHAFGGHDGAHAARDMRPRGDREKARR